MYNHDLEKYNPYIDKLVYVAGSLGWNVELVNNDNTVQLEMKDSTGHEEVICADIPNKDKGFMPLRPKINDTVPAYGQASAFIDNIKQAWKDYIISSPVNNQECDYIADRLKELTTALQDSLNNDNYDHYITKGLTIEDYFNDPNKNCVSLVLQTAKDMGWEAEMVNNDTEISLTFFTNHDIKYEVEVGIEPIEDTNDIEVAQDIVKYIKVLYDEFDISRETYIRLDNTGHYKFADGSTAYELKDVLDDMIEVYEKLEDTAIGMTQQIDRYMNYADLQESKADNKQSPKKAAYDAER